MATIGSRFFRLQKVELSFNHFQQMTINASFTWREMACIILSNLLPLVCLFYFSIYSTAAKPGIIFFTSIVFFSKGLLIIFLKLPSDGCGIRANTQTRIVGGEVSYPGKWPWMAGNAKWCYIYFISSILHIYYCWQHYIALIQTSTVLELWSQIVMCLLLHIVSVGNVLESVFIQLPF